PALAVALGAALAAAQLLPFLEWLPLSAEYARRPPAAATLFDPRCWRELLALPLALFPNLYGNPTWAGPYRSYLPWGNYSENVLYVGTVPLLCALVALRFRRAPGSPVRALAVLVLIAAGMAGMPRAFRIGNLAMYAPAVVAVGGWLAAWGSARGPILVVLAAAELVGLGRGYTPAVPLRDFYPTTPAVSRLAGDRTLHR